MKIVAVSMVRNEEDVIEVFSRYYCQFVDELLIINHLSVDGTVEIINSLIDEGLPIKLTHFEKVAHDQWYLLTQLVNDAFKQHGADLVLPLDADEFLVCKDGGSIRSSLEELSLNKSNYFRVPWRTYVPDTHDRIEDKNILKRITHCREEEQVQLYKLIIPRNIYLTHKVILSHGSHKLEDYRKISKRSVPYEYLTNFECAHFPVRSKDQIVSKTLLTWISNLARADGSTRHGVHLAKLYEKFRNGYEPSDHEIRTIGLKYVAPEHLNAESCSGNDNLVKLPVVPPEGWFDCKYDINASHPILSKVLISAEQIASEYSKNTLRRLIASLRRKVIRYF